MMTREVGKKAKKIATSLRREKKIFSRRRETLKLRSFFHLRRRGTCTGKYVPTLNRPEKKIQRYQPNRVVTIRPSKIKVTKLKEEEGEKSEGFSRLFDR